MVIAKIREKVSRLRLWATTGHSYGHTCPWLTHYGQVVTYYNYGHSSNMGHPWSTTDHNSCPKTAIVTSHSYGPDCIVGHVAKTVTIIVARGDHNSHSYGVGQGSITGRFKRESAAHLSITITAWPIKRPTTVVDRVFNVGHLHDEHWRCNSQHVHKAIWSKIAADHSNGPVCCVNPRGWSCKNIDQKCCLNVRNNDCHSYGWIGYTNNLESYHYDFDPIENCNVGNGLTEKKLFNIFKFW
jgi:hypothetical protein